MQWSVHHGNVIGGRRSVAELSQRAVGARFFLFPCSCQGGLTFLGPSLFSVRVLWHCFIFPLGGHGVGCLVGCLCKN